MSPSPQLSAPGSSSYNSPTMTVGDGTWDSESNTFLLPNLQGLNFDTMRINGMGNRFKDMPGYFNLIQAHGILAAITFLFLVPFAIIFLRFYGRNPRLALRLHIWTQILTVFLSTALFILGYMAVGTRRSLTNPHHGIGVALYTLVLVQLIGGWWVHKRESKKRLPYAPLRAVIHHWIGRIIGLLGLVQVPLGLTLYGAPSYLFILYSLMGFFLVLVYFILAYLDGRNRGRDYSSDYSWASESGQGGRHGRFSTFTKTVIAGVGIGALANRLRNRDEVVASRRHSGSYLDDEKYSQYGRDTTRREGWKGKFLGLGVVATLGYWFGKFLGRRQDALNQESDDVTESSGDSLERIEEGRPSAAANRPLNPALSHQRSHSSLSEDSFISGSPSRQRRNHGIRDGARDAAIGLGTFAFARNYFKKRRDRKEQRRIDELRDQEIRDERVQRANSRRYTGDGYPRPGARHSSRTSTNLTPMPEGGIGPLGAAAAGAAIASAIDRNHTPHSQAAVTTHLPQAGPILPPPPPLHNPQTVHNSSGSELYASSGGRNHHRHHLGTDAAVAGLAGGAAGLAAGEALAAHRRERSESRRRSTGTGSMASPPVSVKLNMHSDGRHVTLRRLTEEEAAAERAARNRSRRRRAGSTGSFSGTDAGLVGGEGWRRTEERERQEQMEMERQQLQASQAQLNSSSAAISFPPPPPPPIPISDPRRTGGPESVGSPGTHDGNATETSTNYADNRRRRRAERAAATTRERQARGGGRAEFN